MNCTSYWRKSTLSTTNAAYRSFASTSWAITNPRTFSPGLARCWLTQPIYRRTWPMVASLVCARFSSMTSQLPLLR